MFNNSRPVLFGMDFLRTIQMSFVQTMIRVMPGHPPTRPKYIKYAWHLRHMEHANQPEF